jgi:hypothetical protein
MKRIIVSLCALSLVLAYNSAFGAAPSKATSTTLNDIPPAWSKTLQCDTTACPRFELVMGGAAVLDHETGLVWEQSPSMSSHDWNGAELRCLQLNTGGRLGWRVPTIQELASLVDPSVPSPGPTLPSGHPFGGMQGTWVWSSTTVAFAPDIAVWVVQFFDGSVGTFVKTDSIPVWCVRGGQGVDPQ